jgi:hypothetical protein
MNGICGEREPAATMIAGGTLTSCKARHCLPASAGEGTDGVATLRPRESPGVAFFDTSTAKRVWRQKVRPTDP